MISVWHLVWIIPLSAVGGAFTLALIVLMDDCLYWANEEDNHFCESQSRYPPDDRKSRIQSKGGDDP